MDLFFVVLSVLCMAVVASIVLYKLKIPTIIGYILTGVISAYAFGFHLDEFEELNHIAELGIIFLMFMIGLEFSTQTIKEMKKQVMLFGGLQIACSIVFFYLIFYYALGFNFDTAIIIACAVSLSSTAIVLKFLNENSETKTPFGKSSVGILIFQDIAVIPILLMITLLSDKDSNLVALLLTTLFSAIIVLTILFLPGKAIAKLFLRFSSDMKTDEIFVCVVLLIVLGAAYISGLFGFSYSLGAFLAGMILANTPYKHYVSSVLVHFRDLFLGVFFVSVGMQVDVGFLLTYFVPIIILVALMMLAKTMLVFSFLYFFQGRRIAMRVALSLSQIGEFSFAIFLLANQHKILDLSPDGGFLKYIFGEEYLSSIPPQDIYQFLTIMVIFSMIATPFILDRIDKVTAFMLKCIPFTKAEDLKVSVENNEISSTTKGHIIVFGYGILGKKICNYLKCCEAEYIAIDSKMAKVEQGNKDGHSVIFGDITHKSMLRTLNIEQCGAVIIAIDSMELVQSLCADLLSIAPLCKIIVKTKHTATEAKLQSMGLYGVVHERRELAKILSDIALKAISEEKLD